MAHSSGSWQLVGFISDVDPEVPGAVPLAELVRPEPFDWEECVARYLDSGHCVLASPGINEPDPLGQPDRLVLGPNVFADDEFIWPQYYGYLLSHHHVPVPGQLIDRAIGSGGQCAELPSSKADEAAEAFARAARLHRALWTRIVS